jgi:hypothetical protein
LNSLNGLSAIGQTEYFECADTSLIENIDMIRLAVFSGLSPSPLLHLLSPDAEARGVTRLDGSGDASSFGGLPIPRQELGETFVGVVVNAG